MRVSYTDAVERSRLPSSKWPGKGPDSRLEPEAWPALKPRFTLSRGETVFSIGSCFARNIESRLVSLGFKVPTVDFPVPASEFPQGTGSGILNKYTAPSIHDEVAWIADGARNLDMILEGPDGCIDLNLAGFKSVSSERAIERRRQVAQLYQHALTADVVVITFGLVEAWWDDHRKAYIQQTPTPQMVRAYPNRWQFEMLDYTATVDYARRTIELLNRDRRRRILITTSPTPLARSFSGHDAIIANTYAKSTLRSVCGALYEEFDNVDYFPSYESVMLSRSAEVWQDDLIHIRPEFVLKVVKRMVSTYVENSDRFDATLDEIVTELKARKLSEVELLNGTPGNPGRFKLQKPNTFSVILGESEETIEFGPVEIEGFDCFACVLFPLTPKEAPVTVRLEVLDARTMEQRGTASTEVNGDQVRWRTKLDMPPAGIVRMRFQKSKPGQSRLQVRHPRFVRTA